MFTNIYIALISFALIMLLMIAKQKHEFLALLSYYAIGVLIYELLPVDTYNYYYMCMAACALITGIFIYDEFKVAAMCSYSLVLVNTFGYLLWYKFYPHDLYNVFSAIMLIIQFLSILPKVKLNGVAKLNSRRIMAVTTDSDGDWSNDKMHKAQKGKGKL